jgi:hypothetical protein
VTSSSGIVVDTRRIDELSSEPIGSLLISGAEREPQLQTMAQPESEALNADLASPRGSSARCTRSSDPPVQMLRA